MLIIFSCVFKSRFLSRNFLFHFLLVIPIFFLVISKAIAQDDDDDNETEQDNTNTAQFCLSKSCYSVFSSVQRAETGGNLQNIQFAGPNNIGGRTMAIMIDQTNSNHVISGGVLGGLWNSNDAGQSWAPINDTALSLSVTCIAQDNLNPNNIYYGGGQVYRDSPPAGVGIFKSTDDGNSFSLLPVSTGISGFLYCNVMKSSVTDSNTLYIGTYSGGLYRTSDGGKSFQQVFPNVDVTDVASFSNGQIMIGVYGLGIYTSPTGDSGTFTKVISGLPADSTIGNVRLDYCKKYPNMVYAVCGSDNAGVRSGLQGIYRSKDYGADWKKMTNPSDSFTYIFPYLTLVLACQPNNPAFVLCGGASFTYSNDSGKTWNDCRTPHIDQHAIVFDPNNPNEFYLGNDAGVYSFKVPTLTTKFNNLNNNYGVTQFSAGAYFPSGMNALAGSWDNAPQLFMNGNASFIKTNNFPPGSSDDNSFYCQVDQQNSNTSYVEVPNGILFRSDNTLADSATYYSTTNNLDADNDGEIDEGAGHNNPVEINLLDGQQLYYLTQERVWCTSNGGIKWQPIMNKVADSGAPSALGISYDLSPTAYMGGENGIFYRIENANTAVPGEEVNLSNSVPSYLRSGYMSCITVDPNNNSNVLVAYNDNSAEPRLMRVTQSTTSNPIWTNISGDLPSGLGVEWVEVDPLNSDSFFLAATDYGLYSTADAGAHWSKESLPNVKILNIRLRKSDRKLFVFTAGRGLWTADLPPSIPKSTSITNQDKNLKCMIYPNPSSNYLNVQIEGTTVNRFQLYIINDLGKIMTQQTFEGTSGTLNINSLARGVYNLQILTEKKNICMQRIIKL
jgi:photosystem II stability/assembly factor-like uncharacterized protein